MGVDYTIAIGIGYHLSSKKLLKPYERKTKPVYRTEDRYDQKTGAKLPSVKVVEKESEKFYEMPDGTKFCQEDEAIYDSDGCELYPDDRAIAYLAAQAGCQVTTYSNNYSDERIVIFHPKLPTVKVKESEISAHVSLGQAYDFEGVVAQAEEMRRIGAKLTEMGIDHKDPVIGYATEVS